jgi:hypothetical protein
MGLTLDFRMHGTTMKKNLFIMFEKANPEKLSLSKCENSRGLD